MILLSQIGLQRCQSLHYTLQLERAVALRPNQATCSDYSDELGLADRVAGAGFPFGVISWGYGY